MENEKLDTYTLKIIRHELNNALARVLFLIDEISDSDLKAKLENEVTLINQFLNESNEIVPTVTSIDLLALVKSILGPANAIDLSAEDADYSVDGNQTTLRHILENLVANACKYSDGMIKISLTKLANSICFEIINDGEELELDEEESLFNYGFRGSNSSRATGEGVGLYYAKKLATSAGYKLSYEYNQQHIFKVII